VSDDGTIQFEEVSSCIPIEDETNSSHVTSGRPHRASISKQIRDNHACLKQDIKHSKGTGERDCLSQTYQDIAYKIPAIPVALTSHQPLPTHS
jgi:hypothetical protein